LRAQARCIAPDLLGMGDSAKAIAPSTLAHAAQRLLEEEIYLGCTQAMLQALAPVQRAAFVLGGICELDSAEAAFILGTSEVAFRKRLSRARERLDAFVSKHCGVANADNRCRCAFQVNYNVALGRMDPERLRLARPTPKTSLETSSTLGAIHKVRRSLELYRAQPTFTAPEDFAQHIRRLIAETPTLAS
jgi:hypothetical protein